MKRSIRRKIQNAMIITNLITVVIFLMMMIPLVFLMIYPATYFITKSVSDDIISRYEDTMVRDNHIEKEIYFSMNESVDTVIATLENQKASEMVASMEDTEMLMADDTAQIMINNENDIKRLMIISRDVFDQLNTFLHQYTMDINISDIKIHVNDYDLSFTHNNQSHFAVINEIVAEHNRSIALVDSDGNAIGEILISTDPVLIQIVLVPLLVLVTITILVTMLLVKFLSKFLSRGIVRPIHQVNRQLEMMSKNEVEMVSDYHLNMKNPPREMAELIMHSNAIYHNIKAITETLENQNVELHVQNEELINNREIIENQNKQLIQSEKMASIGQITAAIVHEINTPIGAIKSNAQLTDMVLKQAQTLDDIEKIKRNVSKVVPGNELVISASNRISEIIKSIKNFSRIDQSDFQEADLHEGIESVLLLTSNLWKSRIKIEKEYGNIPVVMCYVSMINQVILNLITNAIDAIEGSGTIKIKTQMEGDYAVIIIEDDGCGIAEDQLEKVFVQGYTSKPIGKGSGLGLAISKDIVEKHCGKITVDSVQGQGTCFKVMIPIQCDIKNATIKA